jgi:CRP-like cAMP-binding protein
MQPLEGVSSLPTQVFSPGDVVIHEGKPQETLLFLKSGRVEVVRDGTRIALVKTPGSVLGEISLLLGSEATADVIAVEESEFFVAGEPIAFLMAHPGVNFHVAKTLAHRLDAASRYLVDVKEQLADCSDHVGIVDGVLDAIVHRDLKRKLTP